MARQFLSIWVRAFHILRNDYKHFEVDPRVQYRYHRKMVLFWMFNFLPVNCIVGIDIWATLFGHDKAALFTTAILLAANTNYSLYATWDTEVGDAHGSYSSIKAEEVRSHLLHKDSSEQSQKTLPQEVDW